MLLNKISDIILNIFCDVGSEEISRISLERSPVWSNQELFKVPGNIRPLDRTPDKKLGVGHQALSVVTRSGERLLEEGEERMLVLTIRLNLFKPVVTYIIIMISLTLSNSSPLNSNPSPGRTCFKAFTISIPLEFSW